MLRLTGFAFLSLALVVAGCAVESPSNTGTEDGAEDAPTGDSNVAEDEIVSERQLNGSELSSKTVHLTFDDGPGRRTAELADYLAGKGIKSTFFINGAKVPGRQAALDTVVGRGHTLANHTQNHKQLTKLGASTIVREISETDAFIAQVQPAGPWIIRAPFGAWNGSVARAVNASNMKKYIGSVFWDEGGELTSSAAADWDCWGKGVSVDRCAALYIQEIKSKGRGVVLMHDIHDRTVDMVKIIVPALIADGFKFAGIEDVPSVARALGAATGAGATASQCDSATLGRPVDENVCVQSKSTTKWSRCVAGEWVGSTGPADAACKQRFPL